MYKQESVKPYGGTGEKRELVEQMFDNIAPTYDRINHSLSWNIDRGWRRRCVDALRPYRPQQILDVATGTGDMALLCARRLRPRSVTGIDISEGMMRIAWQKWQDAHVEGVEATFLPMDCTAMTFADGTFDAVISAFGIRNFQDLDKGLAEMRRVLRPGGRLSIVELTTPVSTPMRQLFGIYSHTLLPLIGRMIANDAKAYDYLTASIEAFPQGEQMIQILSKAGFREPTFHRLTFGICTLYQAVR